MNSEAAGSEAIARSLAGLKASAVSKSAEGLVIGADQTLDLDGVLHDKPRDLAESRERLRALRGRRHSLHAAVAVALRGVENALARLRQCVRVVVEGLGDADDPAGLAEGGEVAGVELCIGRRLDSGLAQAPLEGSRPL